MIADNAAANDIESPVSVKAKLGHLAVEVEQDNVTIGLGSNSLALSFAQLEYVNKIVQKFKNING